MHVYEVRPRKDHRGVDLISDVLPYGNLWYAEPNAVANATSYAKFFSRSHCAVIRVYDEAGNVIGTHGHHDPAWLFRGRANQLRREYEQAKADYLRVLGRKPDHDPAFSSA